MPTDETTDEAEATPSGAKPAKKAATKRKPARRTTRTVGVHQSSALASDGQEPTPAQALAGEILEARWDLLPSVERIADAPLPSDGVVTALTLFRDSLSTVGDPNRDPRVAIATAAADSGTT